MLHFIPTLKRLAFELFYEKLRIAALAAHEVAGHHEPKARRTWPEFSKQSASRTVILRKRLLRSQMLQLYGSACVFTDDNDCSLNDRLFFMEGGHLVGLEYGGPDVIQNVLPMGRGACWHWEHGIIPSTNVGEIVLSSPASAATQLRFRANKRINIADSRFWPKAECIEWHRDTIFEKGLEAGLTWTGQEMTALR